MRQTAILRRGFSILQSRQTAVVTLCLLSLTFAGCGGGVGTVAVSSPGGGGGSAIIGGGGGSAPPPPTVTGISPAQGDSTGGTAVTISGTRFQTGAQVLIGGKVATQVVVVNATTITALTPPHAPGQVEIQVSNPDNQRGVLFAAFTFNAVNPPTNLAAIPNSGPSSGGTSVTITGSNFQPGATVLFGGANATSVTFNSPTQLIAVTPSNSVGIVDIIVRNPDTQFGTLPGGFTYFASPAPVITGINPSGGPTAGGTTVTITGNNFLAGAAVIFGGVPAATVNVISATQIQAVSPAHVPGFVDVTVRNTDNQSDTVLGGFSYRPAPTISSVAPNAGAADAATAVVVTGTDFLPGATVLFGGLAGTAVTVVSSTQIQVTTPVQPAGTVAVTVTNPDGQSDSLLGGYVYAAAPPPVVTNVAPATGPATGGTMVTITGMNFATGVGPNGGVLGVSFGNGAATQVTFVSSTQITAVTPPSATGGAVSVVVTNPDEQRGSLTGGFTYIAAPVINTVMPASGPAAGNTNVSIIGANFLAGATVTIGGTAATGVAVVSSTLITANTPAHAAGAVAVRVTNPDAQFGSLANGFTYVAAPTVQSVAPNSGTTAGGTAITITGTGFQAGPMVFFDGAQAANIMFVSATQITATTPSHGAGASAVTVRNPDGQQASLAAAFTYNAPVPPPTVTVVNPTSGPTTGGTLITITGTGFQNGATVTVGGIAATPVMFISSTQLTAVTGPHSAGTFDVTVLNPDNAAGSLPMSFTYLAVPTVTSVNPNSGPVIGGTVVTVGGTNFQAGAIVRFGGTASPNVMVVSSTQIQAILPAHAAGVVTVDVENPNAQIGSLVGGFTYVGPPTVTSINPTSGPANGGTLVTVNGTGFQSGATVRFGGILASSVMVISPVQLMAVSPSGTVGSTVSVEVRNPDNQLGTLPNAFTYAAAPPPMVTGIAPANGPIVGNTLVVITGSDFTPGATVFFGGASSTNVVVVSSIEINAFTPAHSAGLVSVVVRNGDGQMGTLPNSFTYDAPPIVTSVAPSSGPTVGGTSVIITGSGFQAGATVLFGTQMATTVVVVSSTQITATTPSNSAGSVSVSVQNIDGQIGTRPSAFTYNVIVPPPTVAAISPDTGPSTGGTMVSVFGTNFQMGAIVLIGGLPGTSTMFIGSTEIRTTTAPHIDGFVDVVVRNPDNQTGTLTNGFSYAPAPPNPLSITTTSLANAVVGEAYLENLAATGGTIPYNWSILSGQLPAGLTLSQSIGQIAGAPTASGSQSFVTQVRDTGFPVQTDSDVLSIFAANQAAGTPVNACGTLANAGTKYVLQNNVTAPESCFVVTADDITLDLNGRTVTYATNTPVNSARFGVSGIACFDSTLQAGRVAQGAPCGGTFRRLTVRNGTITQGANAAPHSHAIRLGQGQCSEITLHNLTINIGPGGDSSSALYTTFCAGNNHIFNVRINDSVAVVINRHQIEGAAMRLADERSTTLPHSIHHNTIVGAPQTGIFTSGPGSKVYSNDVSLTASYTNDFAIYALSRDGEIFDNNVHCADPGRSCRGIVVSGTNAIVRNNTVVARELPINIEYAGCQISGAYGIQFETNSRQAVAMNNTVTAVAEGCDGRGLRASGTGLGNGTISRNNIYKGLRVGTAGGFGIGASFQDAQDFTSIDDVFEADTWNVDIGWNGVSNVRFIRPTFIRGPNPSTNYATFQLRPGLVIPGLTLNTLFVQDAVFQNGASKDSFLMRTIGGSGAPMEYTIQWTYTLTVRNQAGNSVPGAVVVITDALGVPVFSGSTNAFGMVAPVLNEFRRFNTAAAAAVTEAQTPHTVRITAPGCPVLNFNVNMLNTLTESRTLGC